MEINKNAKQRRYKKKSNEEKRNGLNVRIQKEATVATLIE